MSDYPFALQEKKIEKIERFLREQPNASLEKRKAAEKQLFMLSFGNRDFLHHIQGKKPNHTKESFDPKLGKFIPKTSKKKQPKIWRKYKVYTNSFGQQYKVS